jgi:hypothetical protein
LYFLNFIVLYFHEFHRFAFSWISSFCIFMNFNNIHWNSNVYSTFQSHEPENYLKSLEIEEKINKIRRLKRKKQSHFLLSTNDKTIKLWKVSERDKRIEGYNTREEDGVIRDQTVITALRVTPIKPIFFRLSTFSLAI